MVPSPTLLKSICIKTARLPVLLCMLDATLLTRKSCCNCWPPINIIHLETLEKT